jgi:Protein of unknown function (DUF732)
VTVQDYPPTGYTMSPDKFAALDTQLAWPLAESQPYPDEPPGHQWAGVAKTGSAAAAVALVAITAVAVLLNPPGHVESTSVTQTVTATATASPTREADPGPPPTPFVMPTVMAAHETQDGDFLQRLGRAGLVPTRTHSPADAARDVRWAHEACFALARGYTVRQIAIADTVRHPEEGWTEPENEEWVRISAAVYCPELS